MKYNELVSILANQTKLSKYEVDKLFLRLEEVIKENLNEEKVIDLGELGRFEMVHRKLREYNNLFGNKKKVVTDCYYPKFVISNKVKSHFKNIDNLDF